MVHYSRPEMSYCWCQNDGGTGTNPVVKKYNNVFCNAWSSRIALRRKLKSQYLFTQNIYIADHLLRSPFIFPYRESLTVSVLLLCTVRCTLRTPRPVHTQQTTCTSVQSKQSLVISLLVFAWLFRSGFLRFDCLDLYVFFHLYALNQLSFMPMKLGLLLPD